MTLIPWILLLLAVLVQLFTLPVLIGRKDPDAAGWEGGHPRLALFRVVGPHPAPLVLGHFPACARHQFDRTPQ